MPKLTVTIHLTPEDMVEASRTTPPTVPRINTRKMRTRLKIICISILSIVILTEVMLLYATKLTLWPRLGSAMAAVAIYLAFSWLISLYEEKWTRFALSSVRRGMVFLLKIVYARSRGIFCEHTFILSEEGLTEITAVNRTLHPWTDFKSLDISSEFIIARILHRGAHILPRRDFASETDYNQFAQELRLHIPNGYTYDGFSVNKL